MEVGKEYSIGRLSVRPGRSGPGGELDVLLHYACTAQPEALPDFAIVRVGVPQRLNVLNREREVWMFTEQVVRIVPNQWVGAKRPFVVLTGVRFSLDVTVVKSLGKYTFAEPAT